MGVMKTSVTRKKEERGPHGGDEDLSGEKKEERGPHGGDEDLSDEKKGGERSSYQSRVKRKDKILPIFQSILDLDYILAVTQR